MKQYILGNGGFAQEVYDLIFLQQHSDVEFGGYITLNENIPYIISKKGIKQFKYEDESSFVLGTGNKKWRKRFLDHFLYHYPKNKTHFPNIYATNTYMSSFKQEGYGNIYCPFTLVNGQTNIGNFNLFNAHSSIHHDCTIGNNNIICPYTGIMGYCSLGSDNFFGANSIITPKIIIGNNNTISAGECLFDDMNNGEFFQSGIIRSKKTDAETRN
jgi:acetyltransferase-like isoleucine patch superfamily enzyme